MPRLEDWSIGVFGSSLYQTPEFWKLTIRGTIYDDIKRFDDGERIRTSAVKSLDLANNVAQTRNTKYILGEPSLDCMKWFEDNNMTLDQFIK